jgi:hypothetical protein
VNEPSSSPPCLAWAVAPYPVTSWTSASTSSVLVLQYALMSFVATLMTVVLPWMNATGLPSYEPLPKMSR